MRKDEQVKILASAIYEAAVNKTGERLERVADNFCSYLKQKGLIRMIPDILEELERIYYQDKDILVATIIFKSELDRNKVKDIVDLVKSKTGKEVTVKEELDESVIGGAVVRYEDKIIDFSLKSQIRNLARELAK